MTVIEQERVSAPPKEREDAREEQARVLEAAALEIEVRGHARFCACHEDGSVCLGGAVLFALGRDIPRGTNWFSTDDWLEIGLLMEGKSSPDGIWSNFSDTSEPKEVTDLLRWRAEEIRDGR